MINISIIQGIIIIVLFSIVLGVSFNASNLKRSKAISLTLYFILFMIILLSVLNIRSSDVIKFSKTYFNIFMILIGIIAVYDCYLNISKFKKEECCFEEKKIAEKYTKYRTKRNTKEFITKISNLLPITILLLFTYFGIIINIVQLAPFLWISIWELGIIMSILSFIIILSSYFISKILNISLKTSKKSFTSILLIFAVYIILAYLFIPNMQEVFSEQLAPLEWPSLEITSTIITIALLSILSGFFIKRSKKLKNLI